MCTNEKTRSFKLRERKHVKEYKKYIINRSSEKKTMSVKKVTINMISSRMEGLKNNTCDQS